ncbi:hypothetical protein EON67_05805 [archaeon]|nr:MAG: hypothetical protein EON67_05805 [archaeon]
MWSAGGGAPGAASTPAAALSSQLASSGNDGAEEMDEAAISADLRRWGDLLRPDGGATASGTSPSGASSYPPRSPAAPAP